MTNARNLAISIFNTIQLTDSVTQAETLILAYADEIRRGCADRAIAWAKRYDGDDGYEVTINKILAAIMND